MSEQCKEIVYVRDTYRYTGHGPDGFTMHYTRQQCARRTVAANALCWQHQPDYETKRWQAQMASRAAEAEAGRRDGGEG